MEVNGTIFLQILIFLTLLLWLSRSLFAPILRLFDERERRIVGARSEALRLNSLAEEKSKTFDNEYEKAKENARHALTELKHGLEKEHNEMLARAKSIANVRLEKAQHELLTQEQEIREQLKAKSKGLADEIVTMFLRKTA